MRFTISWCLAGDCARHVYNAGLGGWARLRRRCFWNQPVRLGERLRSTRRHEHAPGLRPGSAPRSERPLRARRPSLQQRRHVGRPACPVLGCARQRAPGVCIHSRTATNYVVNLSDQVQAFLGDYGGDAPSDGLYVMEVGGNDIRDAIGRLPCRTSNSPAGTHLHPAEHSGSTAPAHESSSCGFRRMSDSPPRSSGSTR